MGLFFLFLRENSENPTIGNCFRGTSNFKNTLIMMTSNAGVSFDMDKALGFAQDDDQRQDEKRMKSILGKARQVFRPEFLGRIDEIVVMNALDRDAACRIAERMLEEIRGRLFARGIEMHWTGEATDWLAEHGVDAMSGARNLKKLIRERVEDPLSDLILSMPVDFPILVDMENDGIVLRNQEHVLELV